MRYFSILSLFLLALPTPFFSQTTSDTLQLHVPSPAWEDQIIYFLMTDRFNDGDSTNNDQGYQEYDPTHKEKYSGGDIQGVIDQLDYIQNLGATTVWLTPIVANQWWDGTINVSGFHGYWAEHFKEVDRHLGTLVDYQRLSHHLHQRGMYLIQDIVVNHTGSFYKYDGAYDPTDPTKNFAFNEHSIPLRAPTQPPFNLNDVRDSTHRAADIYHWTPIIKDLNSPYEMVNYELGGLDDLNTQNVRVRELLRDAYGYWVRVVGVDGFRIDTVIYVEEEFWNDFMHQRDAQTPGIHRVAKATGRDNFIAFGEAFLGADAYSDEGDKQVARFMGTTEQPGLNSMLGFPLFFEVNRVFSQGSPTAYLGYRLERTFQDTIYRNPQLLVNFIDNHDTKRFITDASKEGLKQALFFQFSIPGIPAIYMGTEQLFQEMRASMFADGWGSHAKDHFDQTSEMYQFLQQLATVRKTNKILTRGDLQVVQDSKLGAGVLVFKRTYQDQQAYVIFNTAEQTILLNNLATELPAGSELKLLHGLNMPSSLQVKPKGMVTTELAPRAAGIFLVEKTSTTTPATSTLAASITTKIADQQFERDILLKGNVQNKDTPTFLVIDGKLDTAIPLSVTTDGSWEATIPLSRFAFGVTQHSLCIYQPEPQLASPSLPFSTFISVQGIKTTTKDAADDDYGLNKNYTLPSDPSYGGQMDIREVTTTAFGGNLQVEITLAEVSDMWLPPNGFDHVLLHLFIDLPDSDGCDYIPMLHAATPTDFKWDYTAYVAGWNTAYYSAEGADKVNFGKKMAISPTIEVDAAKNKITLQFPPAAFGHPTTLKGAKLYLTTWDSGGGEGGYRDITQEGGVWKFGGADIESPVLILDDTAVIEIK